MKEYEGPVDGFAWELANPLEVEPVPVKGIVAPWPWVQRGGSDLTLASNWHGEHLGI